MARRELDPAGWLKMDKVVVDKVVVDRGSRSRQAAAVAIAAINHQLTISA